MSNVSSSRVVLFGGEPTSLDRGVRASSTGQVQCDKAGDGYARSRLQHLVTKQAAAQVLDGREARLGGCGAGAVGGGGTGWTAEVGRQAVESALALAVAELERRTAALASQQVAARGPDSPFERGRGPGPEMWTNAVRGFRLRSNRVSAARQCSVLPVSVSALLTISEMNSESKYMYSHNPSSSFFLLPSSSPLPPLPTPPNPIEMILFLDSRHG
jgi:hypothetical protein